MNTLIDVPVLGTFEDLSWPEVPEVFDHAARLSFRQAWRDTPSPGFQGGEVRLGWNGAGLWVLATMDDDDVISRATGNNQKLWMLADVFEIFIRDLAGEEYLELHTDPKGFWLQLRFASERIFPLIKARQLKTEELMVWEPLFRRKVRLWEGGWDVLACVSAVRGRSLRASFSRYDYGSGEAEPILSSTSAHDEVNFHDQSGWTDLRLCGEVETPA